MAQTYIAATAVGGTTFAANRSLISLFNLNGSSRVIRVYRIQVMNLSIANVAASNAVPVYIQRISAESAGTAITPVSLRSTNEALTTICSVRTNGTTTAVANSIMANFLLTGVDEPAISSITTDELACFPIMSYLWDTGYGDTECDPITLNANQGIELRQHITITSPGQYGFYIHFTVANS